MIQIFCICCGESFLTDDPGVVLCPACGGPPEAEPPLPGGEGQGEGGQRRAWQVDDVILDTYEVKHIFTSGGMGLVYQVHHRGWNIELVVKSPRAEIFTRSGGKENFVREAETWVDLGLHPHIVSCYYVRTIDEIPRVFAEFVEGGSLKDWIENRRLYEGGKDKALERILDIAIQFAWGLAYAHEKGLVHQDVKPANVLMTPDGIAKVSDFGLARARRAAGISDASRAGDVLVSSGGFTQAYCSPEQARGEKLSPKTDIWSWAVSFFEMFTGEVTWYSGAAAGEALEEYLLAGEMEDPLPSISLPGEVVSLLRQCFQPGLDQRPKDMRVVVNGLQGIYERLSGGPYARHLPEAAELRGDSLNNRALSLLDLGRQNEAMKTWKSALEVDPMHIEATYNLGLYEWRNGLWKSGDIVSKLETIQALKPESWRVHYLLGLIELEIGDEQAAAELFDEASKCSPGQLEIEQAIARMGEITFDQGEKIISCLGVLFTDIVFDPNGDLVFSVDDQNMLRVWNLQDGSPVLVKDITGVNKPDGDQYNSLHLTPLPGGKKVLVSGYWDNSFKLWDLEKLSCVRNFQGHEDYVYSVTASKDGRLAVSASEDLTVRLWDLETGDCLKVQEDFEYSVQCMVFSEDGSRVFIADRFYVIAWNVEKEIVKKFQGEHQETILCMSVTLDGQKLLTGSEDTNVILWDLKQGVMLEPLLITGRDRSKVWSLAVTPDCRKALIGDDWGNLELWDLTRNALIRHLRNHAEGEGIYSIAITPDNRFAFSAATDGIIRWDLARMERTPAEWAFSIPTSATEETRISQQARLILVNAETALVERNYIAFQNAMTAFRQIPGYEWNSIGFDLWQRAAIQNGIRKGLAGFRKVRTFENLIRGLVKISPDGLLALVTDKSNLRLIDLRDGKIVKVLSATPRNPVQAIDLFGGLGVSGHKDGRIMVWDLDQGVCWHEFSDNQARVYWVSIIHDGQGILTASEDGVIRFWFLPDPRLNKVVFQIDDEQTLFLALDPTQRMGILLKNHEDLSLFDLALGSIVQEISSKYGLPGHAQFTPDGTKVVYNGDGYGVEILGVWDLATGDNQGDWYPSGKLVVSSDGKFLATSYVDIDMENYLGSDFMLKIEILENFTKNEDDGQNEKSEDQEIEIDFVEESDEDDESHSAILEMGHEPIEPLTFTPDGRYLFASAGKDLQVWELFWDYEFVDEKDWDEGALPYLEIFLTLHQPLATDGIRRIGKPEWTQVDFEKLLVTLGYAGYGWLRPEGVRRKLIDLAAKRG